MSDSKVPGPIDWDAIPASFAPRTPGPLGVNDAADPRVNACWGDTPGSLGANDGADPDAGLPFWQNPGFALTCWLPAPNPNAPRLTDADFTRAANEFGIDAAVIHAVAKVESGGRSGFDAQGRPKILFEAHIFHKFTAGKYDKKYPQLSQRTWEKGKLYYTLDQWTRMYQAMDLDTTAAWKSASWGMFQIMGFNHNGSTTVAEFVAAMFDSEYQHLKSFLAFCKDNKLFKALQDKDWATFARAYNGPKYKENKYDEKMEKAYKKYSPKTAKTGKDSTH
jgi:N-acetylmuramidase